MKFRIIRKNKKGYSLVELLISMAIFAMIMVVFTQVMFQALRISYDNYARTQFRESVEEVLDFVQRDVRNASILKDCGLTQNPALGCTFVISSTEIVWSICQNDPNAICKYEKIGNTLDLKKKTPDNVYVESFDFEVADSDIGSNEFSDSTVIVTIKAVAIKSPSDLQQAQAGLLPLDVQQIVTSTRNER